jgi:hypothetical protein
MAHGGFMTPRVSGAFACAATLSIIVLGVAGCGGGGGGGGSAKSASDQATGLTVTVKDDQVSLKRTAKSTSGTGGTSGTVSCTDDYRKLVKATATPPPTQDWYATTLITWPAANQESKATLSHSLKGDPQLCVAQTADSSTQAIIYFDAKVKAGVTKLQTQSAQKQQAAQAPQALQAAAQAAVGTATSGSFPAADAVVQAATAQGLYVKQAANVQAVTDTGTIYVLADQTGKTKVVLAVKDSKGKVQTATQGVKGAPKMGTAKP